MNGDAGPDPNPLTRALRTATPEFVRRRFALKFFIALLCIGLFVGGVGAVGTEQIRTEFEQQVLTEHATMAKQGAEGRAAWNTRNRNFVETMARSGAVASGDTEAIHDRFNAEMRGRDYGDDTLPNLHYVDAASGRVTVSTKSSLDGEPLSELNATLRSAIEGTTQTRLTDAYTSEATLSGTTPRIAYVTPVADADGEYVVYTVPLAQFTGTRFGSGESTSLVVDGRNRVLFHQSNNSLLLDRYGAGNDAPGVARELGPAESGAMRAGPGAGALDATAALADSDYVVGYAQVVGTDWVVLVHTDIQAAYGTVRRVANQGLWATLLGVAAIGVLGAVLGRNTTRAIDRLTRKTEQMRNGDLDVEVQSGRIDTVGQLYDGFAAMRDSLQDQIAEAERERKKAQVARDEVVETNAHLQNRAAEYSEVMERAAAGDLTQRLEGDGENDAMDAIAEDFNAMIEELEKTVGQLKSFSDRVEESGRVVGESATTVRDAAEQVAESIQRISDDASRQRDDLQQAAETVDEAVAALDAGDPQQAQAHLDDVAATLTDVAGRTEDTMAEAENVAGAAEEQAAELNEVSARADELVRYVIPLSEILGHFTTEAEHEFVFSGGPSAAPQDDD
ncbi:methyl-accepting chemotaxis protein [Haloarcula litorea]|uniref:PDC sensor domain-containing protein n=1 Tax=Haloarcula litorea TaxID=3032579 RepID=UPI0023E7CA39|nr:methyl-accepting chemotaxis protein [Halomicroarcula sp. GDY20]